MATRSDLLLEALRRFFEVPDHTQQLKDILEHRRGVSLRNLEWFVTNYSRQTNVTYKTPTGRQFTVHVAYKSSLDGYSKKFFDPFCRTERIDFQGFTTTVAQLNFIRCVSSTVSSITLPRKECCISAGNLKRDIAIVVQIHRVRLFNLR